MTVLGLGQHLFQLRVDRLQAVGEAADAGQRRGHEAEHKQRKQLRKQRAAMEASEAPKLRATAQREADSAEALKADLAEVAGQLSQPSIEELQARRAGVHELTEAAELAAREFADEPLGDVGTEPWRSLWRAAVDYAAHLEQSLPPDHEPGQCPLCMQDLEPDARERLQRFDQFVRNDLNAKLRRARDELLAGATELDAAGNETEYEAAASEFCRHLREAIERTVEECVLNDVVTRRHDTIRVSRLRKIAWSAEICDLVDRGTDESSPWMHDRPRADGSEPPTPAELREGLEIFEALLKAIKEHRRSGEPTDPPKARLKAVKEDADASGPSSQLEVVDSPGSETRASH